MLIFDALPGFQFLRPEICVTFCFLYSLSFVMPCQTEQGSDGVEFDFLHGDARHQDLSHAKSNDSGSKGGRQTVTDRSATSRKSKSKVHALWEELREQLLSACKNLLENPGTKGLPEELVSLEGGLDHADSKRNYHADSASKLYPVFVGNEMHDAENMSPHNLGALQRQALDAWEMAKQEL